tara:strand:+ start:4220 stop:5434 length:1215 start_codon:yes stop_codon:yes gene_type:complete
MYIELFKTLAIYKNIFEKDINGREINIYKLKDSIASGHSLFYPNILLKSENQLILPLLERTMSLKCNTIYEKTNMEYNYISVKNYKKYYDPIFFFIYNTDNYFHFLYDSLPYLISYLELKKEINNLKLLMQYPNQSKITFYKFVNEMLELLNINKNDIILVEPNTMYSEIYISTSYTHDIDSNLPPRQEIYDLYKTLVNNVKMNYSLKETPKKIYVSRRTWIHNDYSNIGTNYTCRRKFCNEDEFVEKLLNEDYVEVFTEKLSTIEKILYFSNATHVIGAIGGGISNVLFSNSNLYLEAIISPTFLDVNSRFKYSLEKVNVNYNYNTKHIETNEFKTYMRVITNDKRIVGEIEKITNNKLLVSYTDGSNTGWNSENIYKKIELYKKDVNKLDNGLNSPWELIIN